MELSRRGLITGLTSLLAAPAIVRITSIMPVKEIPRSFDLGFTYTENEAFNRFAGGRLTFQEYVERTLKARSAAVRENIAGHNALLARLTS